ncbi:MAG: holo-ACP synthase [Candidatus Omnitrophica bacterium]|nr:holo-ACP synthase [Candidatus Omnitrophota bacterium]MCM8827283.1 holo-ACP synthase [Candidatus Omnitrophota bacterium]
MVKVNKMQDAIEKGGKDFIDKIFNPEELEKIYPSKIYYQRLSARFAAKEAVIKALSKEVELTLKDICILNKCNGAPFCKLKKDTDLNIFLSITHIEDYAVACAVAEKIT